MSEEMKDSKDIIKQIVENAAKKGSISYKEIIDNKLVIIFLTLL